MEMYQENEYLNLWEGVKTQVRKTEEETRQWNDAKARFEAYDGESRKKRAKLEREYDELERELEREKLYLSGLVKKKFDKRGHEIRSDDRASKLINAKLRELGWDPDTATTRDERNERNESGCKS